MQMAGLRRIGSAATLLAVLMAVAVSAPAADAATTLAKCYGLTPTIVAETDEGGPIDGTEGDDVIVGGAGGELVIGNGGTDVVCAGGGDDYVITYGGNDIVAGNDGDDTIETDGGIDYVDGGRGTDQCYAGEERADDRVYGCTFPTRFVVGQSAPDMAGRTAFDNRFRLADSAGSNVMIDFSAIWCGPSGVMSPEAAGVQRTIRNSGVAFDYVLAEVEGPSPGHPSIRRHAEQMSQRYSMSSLPVLHAEGTGTSQITTAFQEFSAENNAYDPTEGINVFYPTQVFVSPAGIVTDVHVGLLVGQSIIDRYTTGVTAPSPVTPVTPPQTGVDIEALRGGLDVLTIPSATKQSLQDMLTSALRAMETRLAPKVSSCSWMQQFDRAVAKTPGIGKADRADLLAASAAIQQELSCGGGGKKK